MTEFSYEAKLPSDEGKAKKFGKQLPKTKGATIDEVREKEMMHRVIKRVKLSSDGWKALQEDLRNNEPKNYIVRRFGIKPNDLKWLKKYLGCS